MSTDPALQDPLLSLRRAIASETLPTPTTSAELSSKDATEDLAKATHLYFEQPIPQSIPLTTPTRFVSASTETAVDLRSIFFAWQKKDVAIPEYIASAQELNEALKQKERKEGEEEEKVLNLVFVERLDLITWLEGASDESEYIKPLEGAAAAAAEQADAAAAAAAKAAPAAPAAPGAQAGKPTKEIDPSLQLIYNGERKLGDRNSVLRGAKPTVWTISFPPSGVDICMLTSSVCRTSATSAKPLNPSSAATAARIPTHPPNQATEACLHPPQAYHSLERVPPALLIQSSSSPPPHPA